MIGSIALTTIVGTIGYVWLTVVTHPLVKGLQASWQVWWGEGWGAAFPLAFAMALVAAAIPCAALVLFSMTLPSGAFYLLDAHMLALGLAAGSCVWLGRATGMGLPRLSSHLELALALAVVSLRGDDADRLARVERRYAEHILGTSDDVLHAVEHLQPV
jgi:hypothetical protein